MKTSHSKDRIKVYSFLQENSPKSFTPTLIAGALNLKFSILYKVLNELVHLGLIQIERVEKEPHSGHTEPFYIATPGQKDISPILEGRAQKPGRKTTITQAQAWEEVEAEPNRFSQIEKVFSFLRSHSSQSFSRRQLEERLKLRAGNLTSILKQLQEQKQVGIEKQGICEYTGQMVYFYYAIGSIQEGQTGMF